MRFFTFVSTIILLQAALAFPRFTEHERELIVRAAKCNDGKQIPRLFKLPPPLVDSSSKKIPDDDHPYIPPGPGDTRGPCPLLNTLANHGYINRSGVDTAENIIIASMEGTNMERDFAAFAASFAVLSRGNANTAMFSIGHPSIKVPPLPGCIDGPVAGGLATHGRFEGDVSITRLDQGLGDNANFNEGAFEKLLEYIGKYGDDGPEGPNTLVNIKTFQELKFDLFNEDQQVDKELSFEAGRQLTAFAETSFVLELMADGRTNRTSLQQLKYFFQNQTFGPDFYRRGSPAGIEIFGPIAKKVMEAHPVPYGHNDANGNYVIDSPPVRNFPCDAYTDLSTKRVAGILMRTKGILKKNVNAFVDILFKPFGSFAGCKKGIPAGPAGV